MSLVVLKLNFGTIKSEETEGIDIGMKFL